ncbi:MAG: transglutaminase domain-containing protein [Bacteroidetes bacterium]|nr:transglutaminase domain-containing protein [Bacteroidota bacterium]
MTFRPWFLVLFSGLSLPAIAQHRFKNEPAIQADSVNADISVEKQWYRGKWRISPEVAHDTFVAKLYGSKGEVVFRTNRDSIRFIMTPGESKSFYIKMKHSGPAHTVITAQQFPWDHISYSKNREIQDVQLFYPAPGAPYFDSLRRRYPIEAVYAGDGTDRDRVLSIMNWVHRRWKHNGGNSPKKNDAISILDEAAAGGRFPCFAYAIVLRDQLAASGFAARVLYLKVKNAETMEGAPGHVVTEVYLTDERKWVFLDGQFNVMPVLNGRALNAVEFQDALSNHYDDVTLASRDQVSKREYTDFVYEYLYYMSTALDSRFLRPEEKYTFEGKTDLMLVPNGAPNLTKMKFFDTKIDYCLYTHSTRDFYPFML